MGYDFRVGERCEGSAHEVTIDERTFDAFVVAHLSAFPGSKLLARMSDAYGDADFAPSEVPQLAAELADLARVASDQDVRRLCRRLVGIATQAAGARLSVFCRGD